jgi:DNA-binding CsgD family transcriptional regulator
VPTFERAARSQALAGAAGPVRFEEPPLVGRAGALEAFAALAATRPGVIVIAGEPAVGTTRLAREGLDRLAARGARVIWAERGHPQAAERLARALAAAGLDADGRGSGWRGPIAIALGDLAADDPSAGTLAPALAGSHAVAVLCCDESSGGAAGIRLEPLSAEDAHELALAAAPGIGGEAAAAVAALAEGLPGHLVPLAREALAWPAGDEPLPIPRALVRAVDRRLAGLGPGPLEVARWMAVLGEPVDARDLARVTGQPEAWVVGGVDALIAAGALDEVAGPGIPRWRFGRRLWAAALEATMAPGDRRRRHAGALVARRSAGAAAGDLVRHAVAARDPAGVVALGVRAARAAREGGVPAAALVHADRALAWWEAELGGEARHAALGERGMALADLSLWEEAAQALEEALAGQRAAGDDAAALATASAASSAHWSAGQRVLALRVLADLLDEDGSQMPSQARAEAFAQAAGMAVMTGRFAEGARLAQRARRDANASGAREPGARALIFLGYGESGRSGSGAGLSAIERAADEAEAGAGARNATLAAIYRSHVLLCLGRAAGAAQVAGAGMRRARELGVVEHELVLAGNLGEALTALGRLVEARAHLERAAAGWAELGLPAITPADPGCAWLLLAEGRVGEALDRYRALTGAVRLDRLLFEQLAPLALGHAHAALAAGAPAEAALVIDAALGAWRSTDDRLLVPALLAAGVQTAEPAEALRLGRTLARLSSDGNRFAAASRLLADGHLAAAEGGDAPGSYRAAARAFAALGMAWWSARATLWAGETGGGSDAAAADLLDARARFREMDAGGWRQRAEAALRAIGRRVPSRGANPAAAAPGFTTREAEVLAHLGLGLSNREIGERLFISEHTVARHLRQVFVKLGVSSRTAAVREAQARGMASAADDAGRRGDARAGLAPPPLISPTGRRRA